MAAQDDLRNALLDLSPNECDALLTAVCRERETLGSPASQSIQVSESNEIPTSSESRITARRQSTELSSSSLATSISSLTSSSTLSSSESAVASSESSEPERGIGYLSGKVIKAVGALELRGLEDVIIQMQLAKWSKLFPHSDSARGSDLKKAYEGILDLIRPPFYRTRLRKKAFGLLLQQLAARSTRQLIAALAKFSSDIPFFVNEVMTVMPSRWWQLPRWDELRKDMHVDLYHNEYLKYINEDHAATPFIDFVCRLTSKSTECCKAVLETDFLDRLSALCFVELFLELYDVRTSLAHACIKVLSVFIADPVGSRLFLRHALHIMWPKAYDVTRHVTARQRVWTTLALETDAVYLRLLAIDKIALFSHSALVKSHIAFKLDVFTDLFGLSGSETQLGDLALEKLMHWMAMNPPGMAQIITTVVQCKCEGYIELISSLFHRVFTTRNELDQEGLHRIGVFIESLTSVSVICDTSKQVFRDAGILPMLLSTIRDERHSKAISHSAEDAYSAAVRRNGGATLLQDKTATLSYRQRVLTAAIGVFAEAPRGTVLSSNGDGDEIPNDEARDIQTPRLGTRPLPKSY